jgi:hypothetical protein
LHQGLGACRTVLYTPSGVLQGTTSGVQLKVRLIFFTHGEITMNFLKLAMTAALFVAAPTWAESLTVPQNNAIRSAKQYLSIQGFSRTRLIQQLSSDAGDGYSVTDATVAVDSLNVDWNKEAVKSAKQYLSIQGFSCKGLIEQLSSSAGDGYTVSQANYGARQAGACQ